MTLLMTPEDLVVGTVHGGSMGNYLRKKAKSVIPAAMDWLQIARLASGNKHFMDPRIDAVAMLGHRLL